MVIDKSKGVIFPHYVVERDKSGDECVIAAFHWLSDALAFVEQMKSRYEDCGDEYEVI